MKIVIEIPEKTNAHIRSDYGHGVKGLRDKDMEIVCDAIYHGIPVREKIDNICHIVHNAILSVFEQSEEERPHGEWIFHKYDKDYECSNCHVRFDRTQIYTEKRFENALWAKMEIYNFCPNCGADMREGK